MDLGSQKEQIRQERYHTMMNKFARLLALLLALVFVLASCNFPETETTGETTATETETVTSTETASDTETDSETETETDAPDYRSTISRSREELEAMMDLSDEHFSDCMAKLEEFESIAVVSDDYDAVDAVYLEFEELFDHISTQISIASVIYYLDMNDEAASSRYLDSYDKFGDIYNEYIEVCKNAYENSPIRDELFADWTEEDIKELYAYDPESQELREENESIQVEINELSEFESDKVAELYAKMVTNSNRLAELAGYDNYYEYASKEIYGRDYSVEDIAVFRGYIKDHLAIKIPLLETRFYGLLNGLERLDYNRLVNFLNKPFDRLNTNYLEGYVNSFEGSTKEGFMHLFENRNMIFSNLSSSHQSAFQTYFDELEMPFCLFGKDGQSTTTIVHEMGHYYAALHHPDVDSYDIAETQSQTNELLLLKYLEGEMSEGTYETLKSYTLYNFVLQSVICVIIDEFEQRVYALDSVEGYGSAEFDAIMAEVCEGYGGIDYITENITDPNAYWRAVATNSPVYYISYATSMVESLNIYAIADKDEAAGREVYRKLVEEVTEEMGFKDAMAHIGLTSPFDIETFRAINNILSGR